MSTEKFDMDGTLQPEDPQDRRTHKNGNRLMILILIILIILSIIAGYYYITSVKNESSEYTETSAQIVEDQSTIETIDPNVDNSGIANSTSSNATISQTNVKPVTSGSTPDNTLALDISKVQSAKARDGAVKFTQHIVGEGEDLNSIAALYGLKVQTIISINEIKNISGIQEGVELSIPDRNGSYYIVKAGDMLSTIANTYCPSLGWKTLQQINGLTDTRLDIGDKIFIPDMSEISANPAINTALNNFIMPTDNGTIIAKYGQFIENNPYNDESSLNGVLIRTSSSVKSAAEGVVVDIQNRNDKKVVKISHKGGYETIYGNLESTSLAIGDEIEAESIIGTVSQDANILYFEIIQSGLPLDPESFF